MCPPAAHRSKDLEIRPPSPASTSRNVLCKLPPASEADGTKSSPKPPFVILLSPQFFILSLVAAMAFAFVMGTLSRLILVSDLGGTHLAAHLPRIEVAQGDRAAHLPNPTVSEGKDVPFTTFASAVFEQEGAMTSHTVHLDRATFHVEEEGEVLVEEEEEEGAVDEDELHLPAGQHLLVDIKNVDPYFLNSEVRLAEAMVELTKASKLTLLSYHCHTLVPSGVSCAGVLLESHVAFHTWPKDGVIAMDLFTCGAGLLIPLLPMIKELFGVPVQDAFGRQVTPEPAVLWSHKLRGFREGFSPSYKKHENPLEQDLTDVLQRHDLDWKVPLASEVTAFQHVDVYEVVDPRKHNAAHVESHGPEKVLFLDGVHQSSLYGDAAYHEALVHPSMIAHPDPKRVAIIGGGEGATLREILKHNTVEEVKMVEIDKELVEICREHLAEWSDCSDMAGSDADSCFDDSRTSLAFEDAFKWFMDSFGKEEIEEEKFDVIIMDALDPDQMVEIVGDLYKDNKFVGAMFNGLNENGVFVIQLGEADRSAEPGVDMGQSQDVENMRKGLESAGFESMHIYEEGHSLFYAPWSYLLCFKNSELRANWYKTSAEIEVELHRRLHRTNSGKKALSFFDGSTMVGYQLPHKATETVYCRSQEEPWECDEHIGIDPTLNNIPMSDLEARKSTIGNFAGRGLFAATDIPMRSTFDVENSVKAFQFLPSSWSIIEDLHDWAEDQNYDHVDKELSSVLTFADGYGYGASLLGTKHFTVDASITTFCNHGCNGTYSYGDEEEANFTEMNVALEHAPEALLNRATEVYSPVFERHLRQLLAAGGYTLRDIRQGEEILCNYLSFVGDPDDWEEDVTSLLGQCSGKMMGDVAQYEVESDDSE